MFHLYVDADACPVKPEIYRVAGRYRWRVTLVANSRMHAPLDDSISLVVVEGGLDAADDWIAERAGPGDVVVTTDIPLAARCLENGAEALGPSGRPFTDDNIGESLATRELLAELRQAGSVTGGPAPFGPRDRSRFLQELDRIVQKTRRAHRATPG